MNYKSNNQKALQLFRKNFCFKILNISEKERVILLQAIAILEREALK